MNVKWKNYFSSIILQRGLDYYNCDAVDNLEYDEDDNMVSARVYGSEIYSVSITFVDNQSDIEDMDCDCPYAFDGNNCKHMAAVLFAFNENTKSFKSTSHKNKNTLEKAINSLSEAQAKEMLLEYAKKDKSLQTRLILCGSNSISAEQKRIWECDLDNITASFGGRDGYIDYYSAYDYTDTVINYLQERTDLLIKNSLFEDASELVCMAYDEVESVEMDDSDGGLCEFEAVCNDYWQEIIKKTDITTKRKTYKWFEKKYLSGNLMHIMFSCFEEKEFLEKDLLILDNEIENCPEDHDYQLESLISYRCKIMQRLNIDDEEINKFRNKYRYLHGVRKQEAESYIYEGRYEEAIKLIKESKRLDKSAGYISSWSEMLVALYQKTHNDTEYREELLFYVFNCSQNDLDYISMLKAVVSEKEWNELREKLLLSDTLRWLRYDFLYSEKLYERLLNLLVSLKDISQMLKYEKELKKNFPIEFRDALLKLLDEKMDRSCERNQYRETADLLRRIKTYPDGDVLADKAAKSWAAKHYRRKAMIEELKTAGFKL